MNDKWNGVERRAMAGFCQQHTQVISDSAVIKNSVQNIEKMMASKDAFKIGVIFSLIVQAIAITGQLIAFAYFYGIQVRQIEINTKRIDVIEQVARDLLKEGVHVKP